MPRRDVVLTGLIAFGAGVAVGANWPKLRKKIGPLLEKLGLQMADLGDFLSASGMEEFVPEAMTAETKARRPRARRSNKAKATPTGDAFVPPATRRNGKHAGPSTVRPSPKRKASRRKPVIVRQVETPLATGTFGD
jgi:hypothetical protein